MRGVVYRSAWIASKQQARSSLLVSAPQPRCRSRSRGRRSRWRVRLPSFAARGCAAGRQSPSGGNRGGRGYAMRSRGSSMRTAVRRTRAASRASYSWASVRSFGKSCVVLCFVTAYKWYCRSHSRPGCRADEFQIARVMEPRRGGRRGAPRKPSPAPAWRPNADWRQLPLFGQVPRDYGRLDQASVAHQLAEASASPSTAAWPSSSPETSRAAPSATRRSLPPCGPWA